MTFRQALALGGHVRRDEQGTTVVYARRPARPEADEVAGRAGTPGVFLKAYTVSNVDQIEGLPQTAQDAQKAVDHLKALQP